MQMLIQMASIALLVTLAIAWRVERKDRRHTIAFGTAVTLGLSILLASCVAAGGTTGIGGYHSTDTTLKLPPAFLPGRDLVDPVRFRVTDVVDHKDRPAELRKFARRLLEDTRDGEKPVRFRRDATASLAVPGNLRREWRLVFHLTLDDLLSKSVPVGGVANLRLVHIRGPRTATEMLNHDEEAQDLAIAFMARLEAVAERLVGSENAFGGRIELQ